MKKIEDINSEIKVLETEIKQLRKIAKDQKKPAKHKVQSDRIIFLKTVILFLETNPTEEYLQRERERLKNTINVLEARFTEWSSAAGKDVDINKRKPVFNKEMNLTHLRQQLKTIIFIINEKAQHEN